MKTHINLGVTELEESVAFYSVLLDARPVKVLPDYALFITEEPALELALDLRETVAVSTDAHFGICVASEEEVERAASRLEAAALASSTERHETCCYANQTKVWAVDPAGRRWEVYTVHEDTVERKDADTGCCRTKGQGTSCCAA